MRAATSLAAAAALVLLLGCAPKASPHLKVFPRLMLWAWEEPQDLRFLEGRDIGIAFFAGQVRLRGDGLDLRRRRAELCVPPGTPLMAVVRIDGDPAEPPTLSEAQLKEALAALDGALSLPGVKGLQIDFDAQKREQAFYARLLAAFRAAHPVTPLSMTALVSWCGDRSWIEDLPVDEAVPMCFRMGPGSAAIRDRLRRGGDFGPARTRTALGLSTDEPWQDLPVAWRRTRRIYIFNPGPWTKDTVDHLQGAFSP